MTEKNKKGKTLATAQSASSGRPALVDEACRALGISNPTAWALVQAADGTDQAVVIDELGRKFRYPPAVGD